MTDIAPDRWVEKLNLKRRREYRWTDCKEEEKNSNISLYDDGNVDFVVVEDLLLEGLIFVIIFRSTRRRERHQKISCYKLRNKIRTCVKVLINLYNQKKEERSILNRHRGGF